VLVDGEQQYIKHVRDFHVAGGNEEDWLCSVYDSQTN